MEVERKISLCPECGACPEVEVIVEDGRHMAVRIGEGEDRVILSKAAWNTLVRYVREGVLEAL